MRMVQVTIAALPVAALLLAGCGRKALDLPTDGIDRAATCQIVAAAAARTVAGVKGELPAEAQGNIFHYALLEASGGESFDADRAAAVFKRAPELVDAVTKRKWQEVKPACDAAYPATTIADPKLPEAPLDSALQCYMLTDFMRKGLGEQGSAYAEAVARYGALGVKLDAKVSPMLKRAGIADEALMAKRSEALAAAAKLGQPAKVIAACEAKYE